LASLAFWFRSGGVLKSVSVLLLSLKPEAEVKVSRL
jgi:hypothetical protein